MNKKIEINKIVKESLSEALICLMKKKPYQSITITELIEKAGVARATYYRNFESKEDVAREYIYNVTSQFVEKEFVVASLGTKEKISLYWKYISDYKDIIILYYNAGLTNLLIEWLSDLAFYNYDKSTISDEDDLYFTAYIGALYNVTRRWLMSGAKVPASKMAEEFQKILPKYNK